MYENLERVVKMLDKIVYLEAQGQVIVSRKGTAAKVQGLKRVEAIGSCEAASDLESIS